MNIKSPGFFFIPKIAMFEIPESEAVFVANPDMSYITLHMKSFDNIFHLVLPTIA